MNKIFLGLGSNLGNKQENILNAVKLISEKVKYIEVAPIYISKAVGYKNQADFYNTVLKGYTDLSPNELLKFVKDIEKKLGRVYRFRWGPREIDIDILFFNDQIVETEDLKIPHPLSHKRDFVLLPMIDLEANFIHPKLNKTMYELYRELKEFSVIGKI